MRTHKQLLENLKTIVGEYGELGDDAALAVKVILGVLVGTLMSLEPDESNLFQLMGVCMGHCKQDLPRVRQRAAEMEVRH